MILAIQQKKTALTITENKIADISNLAAKTALTTVVNKMITNTSYILSWKCRGLCAESIKPSTTSDNSLNPELSYIDYNIRVKFTGSCLKQSKITYTHKKLVNIYIVYELGASSSHIDDPTFKNCLFVAVTLTENADIDKYGYSGYGIGFHRRESFSFPGGGYGQNVLSRYEFFSSY